ncbi:MAG TPA: VOC family protein [Ilumatobacter sp.]|nr:VOC family protein [Ilumatobacter sp.]
MSSRLVTLCINANDPLGLARFWAVALRWEIQDDAEAEITLLPMDGTRFDILFALVPEPSVPGPSRIHLDLTTTSIEDQHDTVSALIDAGGSHLDVGQTAEEGHIVLADPEGNALCIIAPDNNFLASCPRLGALSCDGTRDVGLFWSAALGWPLIWDQDDETAIQHPDGTGPIISWGGPPVAPKVGLNRLHLDIAPPAHVDQQAEVARLIELGATRLDIGQGDVSWVVMADPDGNEFCVLSPR